VSCGGISICVHNKNKRECPECDPIACLASRVRSRLRYALVSYSITKDKSSFEYLGADIHTIKSHLEKQFKDGMTWENHGEVWEIDHIIPVMYDKDNITDDQISERLHYTNLQPLCKHKNREKGNRFIG
jgi:5-methylcytosine-specific restriction endonuclease McrA